MPTIISICGRGKCGLSARRPSAAGSARSRCSRTPPGRGCTAPTAAGPSRRRSSSSAGSRVDARAAASGRRSRAKRGRQGDAARRHLRSARSRRPTPKSTPRSSAPATVTTACSAAVRVRDGSLRTGRGGGRHADGGRPPPPGVTHAGCRAMTGARSRYSPCTSVPSGSLRARLLDFVTRSAARGRFARASQRQAGRRTAAGRQVSSGARCFRRRVGRRRRRGLARPIARLPAWPGSGPRTCRRVPLHLPGRAVHPVLSHDRHDKFENVFHFYIYVFLYNRRAHDPSSEDCPLRPDCRARGARQSYGRQRYRALRRPSPHRRLRRARAALSVPVAGSMVGYAVTCTADSTTEKRADGAGCCGCGRRRSGAEAGGGRDQGRRHGCGAAAVTWER